MTARRRLGAPSFKPMPGETANLKRFGVDWPLGRSLDELGRIGLLLSASRHLDQAAFTACLVECYDEGDIHERCAVLRALPVLPSAERFESMVVDAGRNHILRSSKVRHVRIPTRRPTFPNCTAIRWSSKRALPGWPW
ncbi:MAG: hypothetical protein C4293_11515, partial [Nitrospiraceae bacterium]